jgi:hypothetical protein
MPCVHFLSYPQGHPATGIIMNATRLFLIAPAHECHVLNAEALTGWTREGALASLSQEPDDLSSGGMD